MWGRRARDLLPVWELQLAGGRGKETAKLRLRLVREKRCAAMLELRRRRDPWEGDGFFCPHCRALQPPDPTRDYFSLMDCNRSFRVDTMKLQHRYQQLQRLVHPDFFSQRSQLKLQGIEIPEGTDYETDSRFLMEIMEINEKLAETQNETAMEEIESTVRAKQKEFTDNVNSAFEQGDFERAKEILTKMKYFSNLEEKIKLSKISL